MASLRELGFYGIEALIGEDERMVRDSERAFVTERYLPIVAKQRERQRSLVRQCISRGIWCNSERIRKTLTQLDLK